MRFAATLAIIGSMLALAGCNGDGGSDSPGSSSSTGNVQVSGVTAGTLQYSKTASFTVSGLGLDQGISLSASGCSNVAEAAGASASQRVFTCTVSASGKWNAEIKASNGALLFSAAQNVPVPQVSMKTSMGDLLLELYPNQAPITVANFLQYVNANFYNKLIFHRVVANFVVQGGGYNAAMQAANTRAPIKLEVGKGLSNLRGTLAMARTGAQDSATSQFFINSVDNIQLDTQGGGYAVFGKVVSGLSVVDQINLLPTSGDVPLTPVLINSMTQVQ